jgi:succinate-semialdehyde dehydrogenase/glutarate-semialdehyde dehydrogenase
MHFKLLIDGEWADARGGRRWSVINPATEEPVQDVPFGDASDAEDAIAAAAAAQPRWAAMGPYERGKILRRTAELIAERREELAAIMTAESGKPLAEARGEWGACADVFEWYAEEGKRAYGRAIPSRHAHKRLLSLPVPVGVVATITAWNFPALLVARKWAAALAAGCTVVGRPSELTPLSAMALANLLVEAGLPPGALNLVNGEPGPIGEAMLASPHVEKLSFTGSQNVGRILMRGAAEGIKRLSMELGGSAPVLVFEDADPAAAARLAVATRFRNNGQVCISPNRFYVQRPMLEEFIESAAAAIDGLSIGNGADPQVTTGPLITAAGREKIEGQVADAVAHGAQVVRGGGRPARLGKGYFYEPTLLLNLRDEMRVLREEVFGPVMLVQSFDSLEDGLARANGTPYGLAGYVIARDHATIVRAYEGLNFGVIGVNDLTPATAEAPFGGLKQSGFGRENAQEGLEEYLEHKFVSMAV